jgi:hypothetical protein
VEEDGLADMSLLDGVPEVPAALLLAAVSELAVPEAAAPEGELPVAAQ